MASAKGEQDRTITALRQVLTFALSDILTDFFGFAFANFSQTLPGAAGGKMRILVS
jgi:hypothetical protein